MEQTPQGEVFMTELAKKFQSFPKDSLELRRLSDIFVQIAQKKPQFLFHLNKKGKNLFR